MSRRKLIIDTDPGVDDALALFCAFNSPEVRVVPRAAGAAFAALCVAAALARTPRARAALCEGAGAADGARAFAR